MIDSKQQKQNLQSKLLIATFKLPLEKQIIQNYQQLKTNIQAVSVELNNQAKINIQQIQRVCKGNVKLLAVAHLLRQHVPPEGMNKFNYSVLISSIINMFTLMMTSTKMIQFFNKLSIPFSIYRIIARTYSNCISQGQQYKFSRLQFLKRVEVEQSFKFIWKMIVTKSRNFPRLFAFLILNVLNQYNEQAVETDRKAPQNSYVDKQKQRFQQTIKTIINIGIQLIKNNLRLAADTGVLVAMYKKACQNNLNMQNTNQLIQVIANHMKTIESRDIVLSHCDLCRVFAIFTNIDFKLPEAVLLVRIQKAAFIIQSLLSHTSTLFYFIHEKMTLKNFVISLKSKSKSEKEKSIVNNKIFMKLIDKALRFDRNKMQKSNNIFGLNSNYLNYKTLLILSFFLISTDLFQICLNTDPNSNLFAGLGRISLMYFPITFQKGKFNKQIIQTIKIPSASDIQRLNKDFLNILSYYDYCIVPYQLSKTQLISYLLYIKQLQVYSNEIPESSKQAIQNLLLRAKNSSQNYIKLLLDFYIKVMQICQVLLWKPEYLKLTKFLSIIVDFLRNHKYSEIMDACLNVVNKIFSQKKRIYYRYLYISALDDAGKYFQDHQIVQKLILDNLDMHKKYEFSFRISRILLHTDLNKKQDTSIGLLSHKELLQKVCASESQQLVLQVIQIIKFYCIDYDEKSDWGAQIIYGRLIYSNNDQIACAAVQFCQQFVFSLRNHKNYLFKIRLSEIKDSNLRKRIMFLMLNSQKGIEILNSYNPSFIKDEIDLWLKQGNNLIRQFSLFLSKENKKFTSNKDTPFLDIGKIGENRHRLIYLPWNILINQKRFIALATYKFTEQRIKLRVSPEFFLLQPRIQITYFDIGGFSFSSNFISVKKQQIIKNFQRNRIKENKQIKKFAILKQNATLFFKYQPEGTLLVLSKIMIDIPLSRDVYKSISYPLSFITLMTKTGKGFNYLRQYRFIHQCIKFCKFKQDKQQKQLDIQLIKGSIQCLGLLFASWKLQHLERIQIYAAIIQVFQRTTNFQLKEVCLWVLNIIIKKDDDLRAKLKSNKGWLIMQSKYCGWLCFPQFYTQTQFTDKSLNQFASIMQFLQKNKEGCPLTLAYQQSTIKNEKNSGICQKLQKQCLSPQVLRRNVIQFFKSPENKQLTFNPKLLDKVVTYLSIVNFKTQRTWQMLDLFTDYFLSEKFDSDLIYGSSMP